jgi:hypothetical protein
MVIHLTGGKTLPAEVVEQVIAKTDGVPLFVEEILRMILESRLIHEEDDRYILTGPLSLLAIPSTLHDSLMARLDRLAPVKAIAQLGAVLGREFMYEVIHAVAPMEETALQQGLAQLVDAALFYQRGRMPHATYLFKVAGMRVYGLLIAASILLELGYPDQALQRSNEALSLAQELSHPFTLAWALWKAAKLHQCRREEDATHERAETAIALSTAQGFPLLLAGSTFLQG